VSVHKKLNTSKTEGSCYELSPDSTSTYDASESFIYSYAQPTKKVELEPSFQLSSSFLFEDSSEEQVDTKYTRMIKENEMLRQRLELSEKLLLTVLQQRMNADSSSVFTGQIQAPDMFRESASFNNFDSGFLAPIEN